MIKQVHVVGAGTVVATVVDEGATTHVLDAPGIGFDGAWHTRSGPQWFTYCGCRGWLHGCPAVANGVHEFIRHHSVDRHCTSDVHPPDETVEEDGVVVTAGVVIEGVDVVDAVVAAPDEPQLGDTCQLCIPLSLGMRKHPA